MQNIFMICFICYRLYTGNRKEVFIMDLTLSFLPIGIFFPPILFHVVPGSYRCTAVSFLHILWRDVFSSISPFSCIMFFLSLKVHFYGYCQYIRYSSYTCKCTFLPKRGISSLFPFCTSERIQSESISNFIDALASWCQICYI